MCDFREVTVTAEAPEALRAKSAPCLKSVPQLHVLWIAALFALFSSLLSTSWATDLAPARPIESKNAGTRFCQNDLVKTTPVTIADAQSAPAPLPVPATTDELDALSPSGIEGYFLMQRLLETGNKKIYARMTELLPKFKKMGINTLWISPPNPQTTELLSGEIPNVHGYWVKDHGKTTDNRAFKAFVQAAHQLGIEICLDTVTNHFGYVAYQIDGKWVYPDLKLGRKTVSPIDPAFFRIDQDIPEVGAIMDALYKEIDRETNPEKLHKLQAELTRYNLAGLPSFNYKNAAVRKYLISSYKKFVDMGIRVFRMDAGKHVDQEFIYEFMNAIGEYGKSKGQKITFLHELLFTGSPALAVFAQDALNTVAPENARVFFLDFPMAIEFLKLQDPNYQFNYIEGFIRYREDNQHPVDYYVPMLEDHDLLAPIRDSFNARLIYTVTNFFSRNPVFLNHGAEQSGVREQMREKIADIDETGDIAQLNKTLTQVLAPYRTAPHESVHFNFHIKEKDILLVELKLNAKRSLFLYANKGGASANSAPLPYSRNIKKITLSPLLSENAPLIELIQSQSTPYFKLSSEGKSFAVFEVTQ